MLYERIGTHFKSLLVEVSADDSTQGFTKHLEYYPMINGRTHSVGGGQTILNQTFKNTYERFLTSKVQKPSLSNEEKLCFVYYLQLQDRIKEAIKLFESVQ